MLNNALKPGAWAWMEVYIKFKGGPVHDLAEEGVGDLDDDDLKTMDDDLEKAKENKPLTKPKRKVPDVQETELETTSGDNTNTTGTVDNDSIEILQRAANTNPDVAGGENVEAREGEVADNNNNGEFDANDNIAEINGNNNEDTGNNNADTGNNNEAAHAHPTDMDVDDNEQEQEQEQDDTSRTASPAASRNLQPMTQNTQNTNESLTQNTHDLSNLEALGGDDLGDIGSGGNLDNNLGDNLDDILGGNGLDETTEVHKQSSVDLATTSPPLSSSSSVYSSTSEYVPNCYVKSNVGKPANTELPSQNTRNAMKERRKKEKERKYVMIRSQFIYLIFIVL